MSLYLQGQQATFSQPASLLLDPSPRLQLQSKAGSEYHQEPRITSQYTIQAFRPRAPLRHVPAIIALESSVAIPVGEGLYKASTLISCETVNFTLPKHRRPLSPAHDTLKQRPKEVTVHALEKRQKAKGQTSTSVQRQRFWPNWSPNRVGIPTSSTVHRVQHSTLALSCTNTVRPVRNTSSQVQ